MNILDCSRWRGVATGLLLLLVLHPAFIQADEIRPAMLQIEEREGGWIDVTWKIPVRGERSLGLTPVLPDFLAPVGPASGRLSSPSGGWVEYSSPIAPVDKPLTGATLSIDGLGHHPDRRARARRARADGIRTHG